MALKKKKETGVVVIEPLQMARTQVEIIGDTPLIMHAWSAKAKRQMLHDMLDFPKIKAREAKDPWGEFVESAYWLTPMPETFEPETVEKALETARFGFPVSAFKEATLATSSRLGWGVAKTVLNTAFFIEPNADGYFGGDLKVNDAGNGLDIIPNVFITNPILEIFSDKPIKREDMVRVGGISKTADIRYRAEFRNWRAVMDITYNVNGPVSLEQILNGLNAAGKVNGVGEMRIERGGYYGSFHVQAI